MFVLWCIYVLGLAITPRRNTGVWSIFHVFYHECPLLFAIIATTASHNSVRMEACFLSMGDRNVFFRVLPFVRPRYSFFALHPCSGSIKCWKSSYVVLSSLGWLFSMSVYQGGTVCASVGGYGDGS